MLSVEKEKVERSKRKPGPKPGTTYKKGPGLPEEAELPGVNHKNPQGEKVRANGRVDRAPHAQ